MAQVLVNVRMDEEDKKGMEDVCRELGMSMTTAFTIFAKKMKRVIITRCSAKKIAKAKKRLLHD